MLGEPLGSPGPHPLSLKCEGQKVYNSLRDSYIADNKKERQAGKADSLSVAYTINTSKTTVSAEERLAYSSPLETYTALTVTEILT